MGKGADYIAAYTKKKFGTSLCFDCAQKRADKPQDAPQQEEIAGVIDNG